MSSDSYVGVAAYARSYMKDTPQKDEADTLAAMLQVLIQESFRVDDW